MSRAFDITGMTRRLCYYHGLDKSSSPFFSITTDYVIRMKIIYIAPQNVIIIHMYEVDLRWWRSPWSHGPLTTPVSMNADLQIATIRMPSVWPYSGLTQRWEKYNFHSPEVAARGSEAQLQVGKNVFKNVFEKVNIYICKI